MTTHNHITPEEVKKLLQDCFMVNRNGHMASSWNQQQRAIAEAYLEKCEESDGWRAQYHKDVGDAQKENHCLQATIDGLNATIELMGETNAAALKVVMEQGELIKRQSDVLRACNFYLTPLSNAIGGRNREGILNELVCEALSLTATDKDQPE